MLPKTKVYKFGKVKAEIDVGLNNEHLNDLNKNKKIEISSVCAGHSKKNPAHIIFHYKGKENIKKKLIKIPNTKVERHVWRGSINYRDTKKEIKDRKVFYTVTSKKPKSKKWWEQASMIISKIK